MATEFIEFENRADYESFIADSEKRKLIRSIFLYWYEGKGRRGLKMSPGRNVTAYWDKLSLEQKVHQCFEMPAELKEAFSKDYEENGGMTEATGKPEDAVIVVEYEKD